MPADADDVRPDDAFDVEAVASWLHAQVPGLSGVPRVQQFRGGASNLTYLLSFSDRDLILRRPPPGTKAKSAHDMGREFRVQQRLGPVYPYVPAMVAFCDDDSLIGSDFYVMDRVEGLILRRDLPTEPTLDEAAVRRLCTRVIDLLIELHRVDIADAGLTDLGRVGGYVERQVSGWSKRYRAARTPDAPSFEPVMQWLAERRPDDVATAVIHNDFRFDNIVMAVRDGQADALEPVAVLDWEMATLGDPLMDLGGVTAYWVQADDGDFRDLRLQPTHAPGMMTRDEVVAYYVQATGHVPADWSFYELFGLFRLAGIAQQIYYRHYHGQTHDPAGRRFGQMVHVLDTRCSQLIAG